jgi:P-type conjugative transfer protein TrbJ
MMLASAALDRSAPASRPQAQLTVFDPTNLIQNALNATRALEQIRNQVLQITNQIRQLENDARNLTSSGEPLRRSS